MTATTGRSLDIGISEGHHDLSHHQNKADRVVRKWRRSIFGMRSSSRDFLQKLEPMKDMRRQVAPA